MIPTSHIPKAFGLKLVLEALGQHLADAAHVSDPSRLQVGNVGAVAGDAVRRAKERGRRRVQ